MKPGVKVVLLYLAIQLVLLVALGIALGYLVFASNSGWQYGAALIFSAQMAILALLSTLVFGVSMQLAGRAVSCAESAWLGLAVVVLSAVLSLLAGLLLGGLGAFSIFQLLLLFSAFLAPRLLRCTRG